MPQIPRGQDINRRTPDLQKRITVEDTRNAGGVINAVSRGLEFEVDRRSRLELAKAESAFLTQKSHHDSAYDTDEDYASIPERYDTAMNDSVSSASALISDPRIRERFALNIAPRIAEGGERIRSLARSKEVDYETASLNEGLQGIRESGVTGSAIDASNAARDYIKAAVENDIISATRGQQVFSAWQTDMAVGKLEMMEPEERVVALAEPWAEDLPSDTRNRILKRAQQESGEDTAILKVDEWMREGVTPVEANARFSSIEDTELRVEVERRFNNEWMRKVNAESQQKVDLINEYLPMIRSGEMRMAQVPPEVVETLGREVTTLYNAENQAAVKAVPKVSDKQVLWDLYQLDADPSTPGVLLETYFRDNASSLSDTDFKLWASKAAGRMTPEDSSTMTYLQYVDAQAREAWPALQDSRRSARAATFRLQAEEWRNNFLLQNTREPTTSERNNFIDSLFLELPTRTSLFGGATGSARWGEMDNEQRGQAISMVRKNDRNKYDYVLQLLGQDESTLNPEQFAEAYSTIYEDDIAPADDGYSGDIPPLPEGI